MDNPCEIRCLVLIVQMKWQYLSITMFKKKKKKKRGRESQVISSVASATELFAPRSNVPSASNPVYCLFITMLFLITFSEVW